jgi:N6-L-threonylcarbamoyladenine synthase
VNILGIETSCDETSAAVVQDGTRILSNIVSSQIELHRPYGGVVPELASRNHLQLIDDVIRQALDGHDFDAVAATYGPGLASSLLIGLNAGKGIAFAAGKPFIGINHMEAHLYSPVMNAPGALPMVSLIVSGGHTILVHATGIGQHRILGQTVDDAAGEAFDKVAKLLKLGYPGGPEIDQLAKSGNPAAISFPRSMMESYNFSFSGLKTSVLYFLRNNQSYRPEDICASFQEAVVDVLVAKTIRAAEEYRVQTVSASGGVSINSRFRERLTGECQKCGLRLLLAPAELCTDNAAMIAALAFRKAPSDFSLDVAPSIGLGVPA